MASWIVSGLLPLRAQQANTLYLMHEVPQANLLNPAVQLQCRFYIGIPALTSFHLNYSNTAFTYNDLAGTNTWNSEGVLDQMHRVDLFAVETRLHLLSLGYRRGRHYFTFHIAENIHGFQTVPGDLAQTFVEGNGPFIGETAKYDGLRPGFYHVREYSLGISRVFSERLTAGIRARLLFGKSNLCASRSRMRLATREDNFGLLVEGDYTLNSSFPYTITQDEDGNIDGIIMGEIDPYTYLLNRGNPGFAIDLGAIYRYTEKITLSASLLDLGFVRWKTDVNNVHGEGSFIYDGIDVQSVVVSREYITDQVDSLLNAFDVSPSTDPYTYFYPVQLYLGASYQWRENISLGLVNRNLILSSKLNSSFTLLARADLLDRISATASWSYLNNSLKNVGVGIAYHGKGIQFHAVSDNLLGFFYPFDTRTLNLRFGINLMLGCPRDAREKAEEDSWGKPTISGECPWVEDRGKLRKRRIRAARKRNK
jgi:hypothetical protein